MKYDAVIVGSGPNGLAAAITLAHSGLSVLVVEGNRQTGGGMRTTELIQPGFIHDICSAVHPLAFSSPFFKKYVNRSPELEWIHPPAVLAHPLENEPAVLQYTDLAETQKFLGEDAENYRRIMKPLIRKWNNILPQILAPVKWPRHPLSLFSFGILAIQSASGFSFRHFKRQRAKALFSGMAAHSMLPLDKKISAAAGLVLTILGHTGGWPIVRGGSQKINDRLVKIFQSYGGEFITGQFIESLNQLPESRAVIFDTSPRQMENIVGERFSGRYREQVKRFRYGPGVFKMDWALNEPVPFTDRQCHEAATVHIGGSLDEISASEELVWQGKHPENPFVILVQPTLFDPSRAPSGKHVAWAYCHVPGGSSVDMTGPVENQIERFAPGFRETIIGRHTMNSVDMENYNPNYIGGDINGGIQDWQQLFFRPAVRWNPYTTPDPGIFICSSSTPPGGGVHGMGGYNAARTVLKNIFSKSAA